uniref:non-specific serine/threonine protein kinase n=1 Tax=Ananas comosus var. bracteatus TaxID=296719 RepID=A0A6V7NL42_ANACO|nr:unnamed protein product [Ananas comosus var. bracteatus]
MARTLSPQPSPSPGPKARNLLWASSSQETPIADPDSSDLPISDNVDLVLFNPSKSPIWSAGANLTPNSTVAVILDTGSLVLRDGSDPSSVFWLGIDHPTNLAPGGKLGVNKLTGIFSYVPEITTNYIYKFECVTNAAENYFTCSVKDDSITPRFIMQSSGLIQQLTCMEPSGWMLFWSQPRAQCEVYALCRPFGTCNQNSLPFCNCLKGFVEKYPSDWSLADQSRGCVRKTQLNCGVQSSAKTEKIVDVPCGTGIWLIYESNIMELAEALFTFVSPLRILLVQKP